MEIKDILNNVSHRSTFDKGKAIYQSQKIENVKQYVDQFDGNRHFSAEIEGSRGNVYLTSFAVSEEEDILEFYCTCPAYESYTGACKHIVGLMLHIYAQKQLASVLGKPVHQKKTFTDRNAQRLISAYTGKNIAALKYEIAANEKVCLVPKLTISCYQAELSLTVGNRRQYVVKNVKQFCQNMKHGEETFYGKDLTLLHHISAFEETSKPLVSFLMERNEELESYANGTYYGDSGYGYDRTKRYMQLGPATIDQLLDIYVNREISICGSEERISYEAYRGSEQELKPWKEEKVCSYKLQDGNPRVTLKIGKVQKEKYFISASTFNYIKGKKHIYLAEDKEVKRYVEACPVLFRCDEDFSENMREFIEIISQGNGYLTISQTDMANLCANVIPQIQQYVTITEGAELITEFAPVKGRVKIYLDSPDPDVITAMLHCEYTKQDTFDLVSDERIKSQDGSQADHIASDLIKSSSKIMRDRLEENKAKILVTKHFDAYDGEARILYFTGDDDRIYHFVNEVAPEFTKFAEVLTTEKYRRIGTIAPPKISIGVKLDSELLKLDFDLDQFPIPDLLEALQKYKQKKKYCRLSSGSFVDLKNEEFGELMQFVDEFGLKKGDLQKGHVILPKYRALYLNHALKHSPSIKFERDGHFKSLIRGMNAVEDSDYPIPEHLTSVLRDYQKDGYQWLRTMSEYGFCGILADEMGLGKTLQVIALLESARKGFEEDGKTHLALVVCPASLVLNWKKEIEKFVPEMKTITVIGTAAERKKKIKDAEKQAVILTSYDLLRRDIEHYQEYRFDYYIIDEAQYIKNQNTQNAKAVKLIRSKQRFALTGTPIENRLSELWSIFDFLMPQYLFSYLKFKEHYETAIVKEQDEGKSTLLKQQVAPFMLRRLKKNVLKELPEKTETVIYAKMEAEQEKLYRANLAKVKMQIDKEVTEGKFSSNKLAILTLLLRLRQICCHPALCYEDYEKGSGKLDACMELIEEAVSGGHKVLVFSQFTSMLEILEKAITSLEIKHYKLTGSTSKEKRADLVERFNQVDDDTFVFLISLKAGGTGLNLTAADVVIHYDPWWNLAAQNQATDRAHRIGQKNHLQVYKIIAEGSIEEKILKLQESKQDLADSIITENEAVITSMSGEDLLELLS